MIKHLIVSTLVAAAGLAVPAAVSSVPANAAVVAQAAPAYATGHACTYRRDGNVWRCITPGAYCPKAARNRSGYAKVTNRKYRCSQYTSTTWRWKRV